MIMNITREVLYSLSLVGISHHMRYIRASLCYYMSVHNVQWDLLTGDKSRIRHSCTLHKLILLIIITYFYTNIDDKFIEMTVFTELLSFIHRMMLRKQFIEFFKFSAPSMELMSCVERQQIVDCRHRKRPVSQPSKPISICATVGNSPASRRHVRTHSAQ